MWERHRNTEYLFSNRSATNSRLKGLMLVLGFAVLFGCQMSRDTTVPDELIGEWVTTEPRYQDCSFEIQKETIIFNKGTAHTDMNSIEEITKIPEKEKTLYHIYYEDKQGQEYKLSLFFFKTHDGGIICFKNQQNIIWSRKVD